MGSKRDHTGWCNIVHLIEGEVKIGAGVACYEVRGLELRINVVNLVISELQLALGDVEEASYIQITEGVVVHYNGLGYGAEIKGSPATPSDRLEVRVGNRDEVAVRGENKASSLGVNEIRDWNLIHNDSAVTYDCHKTA